MGINKVQYGNTTLIDLTNDTVTADKLMQGYTAHDRSGAIITGTATGGGTGAISVVDTEDTHGGTIRTITAVDISDTTAVASDVAQGKYFYTADGTKTAGTSSGGGDTNPTAPKKQINFIDYDGTIRYSYTSSEWASVTALPSNPSHSGLVAQGWNWTKAQIDAQLTEIPNGDVWVGQMYITESGDTEIDVAFFDSARLSPIMTICVNGTVEVDWGDNTTADTVTGTSLTSRLAVPHTYASAGSYMIKIHVVSGGFTFYGTASYTLLRKNTTIHENRVYANTIKAVRIGNGVANIGTYAFYYCSSLVSVTIPSTVTNIGTSAFQYCYSLASLTIPNGVIGINGTVFMYCNILAKVTMPSTVTTIANSAFSSCYALASLTIPNGVTSIGNGMISSTYSFASLIIPSTVTSIGGAAFSGCYGMAEYHFKSTTPPTLGTNAFNNIVSDCKIYVPSTSLEAYQTAENWSTYASYMVGE